MAVTSCPSSSAWPSSAVPGEDHGIEPHLICHRVQGHLGVGVPRQGRQTLEVQDKIHLALRGQPALDLCLEGQEVRLWRVGEEIGVIALQGLVQDIQVLLPGLQSGGIRRLDSGAGEQGGRQGQRPGSPEKSGMHERSLLSCIT